MKNFLSQKIILVITLFVMAVISSCTKNESPGPNEVFMNNNAFDPATITVSSGATITWTNKEESAHTVTENAAVFSSGDLGKGNTFSFTFTTTGTFNYECIHHSGMTGKVIVQ